MFTTTAGSSGVVIWISASRPEIYSLTNAEIAAVELRGSGTTAPLIANEMLGWVNWKGCECTAATVTAEEFPSTGGSEMKKGRAGAWKSTFDGMGLRAVALAESSIVPLLEAIAKDCRWTRSEN